MTFNGFGSQTAWPDGTGFNTNDFGDVSKGTASIQDLCQGMSNCVRKLVQLELAKFSTSTNERTLL